jgi:hypothetical protein
MLGDYALPVCTGSDMLDKLTKTSSEYFNRKVHSLLDLVMTMEHKYKLSDPKALISDPEYALVYGPLALIGNVNDTYGRLLSDRRWPALATKLPQSNNASKVTPAGDAKCFRCQGPHLVKDCPKKGKDVDSKDEPPAKKDKASELPAWKYLEPKDLTKALTDEHGREWKFCT